MGEPAVGGHVYIRKSGDGIVQLRCGAGKIQMVSGKSVQERRDKKDKKRCKGKENQGKKQGEVKSTLCPARVLSFSMVV